MLKSKNRQLKPLLMDQHFLAGVGNIYSDEALFEAGLHPLSISSNLDQADARRLWRALRSVLEEGIARNGSSIDWVYRGENFKILSGYISEREKSVMFVENLFNGLLSGSEVHIFVRSARKSNNHY